MCVWGGGGTQKRVKYEESDIDGVSLNLASAFIFEKKYRSLVDLGSPKITVCSVVRIPNYLCLSCQRN